MMLYSFLLFEVFLCVMLCGAFLKREVLLWAFAAVLSGILAFVSYNIVLAVPLGSGVIGTASFGDTDLFMVHVGIMMVSTVMMLLDLVGSYNWSLVGLYRDRKKGGRK